VPTPAPPDVPTPQGLGVAFTDDKDTRVANSVRGVLFYKGYLYVADEPADAVKVYDGSTGELYGQIAGGKLSAPVQLLLDAATSTLYIGSTGKDSVVSCDLSQGAPSGVVKPETFIDGEVKHVSGMSLDADGNFYAAERKAKKIKKFPPDGSGGGEVFIQDLPDSPEFILYVPKGDG
jgi:sugar lactone lactonase YvrE